MPDPITGIIAGGSSLIAGGVQASAASDASDDQVQATTLGIEEQRRQFDAIQELLSPFVETGTDATNALSALAGLSGPDSQQQAIQGIESSPEFQALLQQGEEGILANASATGGLRGGNTQSALAEFRPSLLSQQINNQYSRLTGLAGLGQASAAGQAAAAQTTGSNISDLLQQQGAARAGASLAQGQAFGNVANDLTSGLFTGASLGLF